MVVKTDELTVDSTDNKQQVEVSVEKKGKTMVDEMDENRVAQLVVLKAPLKAALMVDSLGIDLAVC